MRIVAIIQARLSSRRLPGKVLAPLAGKPLLAHLVDRMCGVRGLDGLVLATSQHSSDDPLAAWATDYRLNCWRGPLDDVLGRVRDAAKAQGAEAIVRLCGDSPLMCHEVVEQAVALFRDLDVDLVTNVMPRSFPKGQSVEVVSMAALRRIDDLSTRPEQREHVTGYFYTHPHEFKIHNFSYGEPRGDLQLSVDDSIDFERATAIITGLKGRFSEATLAEIIAERDRLDASRSIVSLDGPGTATRC